MLKNVILAVCLCAGPLAAQETTSETGAVNVWISSGWSFGLPANRAVVSVPGVGTAISPEKKTLVAPSFGASVTAWKYLVPFFELGAYDAGKATASVGNFRSQIEGEILTINGGLRVVAGQSKFRPYVQFGGGSVYQKPKITFTSPSGTTTVSQGGSIGNIMYGAGFQSFIGRRWGVDVGFDGFHLTQELAQGGSTFSRVRFGLFFQTKSKLP